MAKKKMRKLITTDWRSVVAWLKEYHNFLLGEHNDYDEAEKIMKLLEDYNIKIEIDSLGYIINTGVDT